MTTTRARVLVPAAVALVVALGLRAFVVGLYLVPSASMAPTLLAGDRIVVDKLAYRHRAPERGDVAVLVGPDGETYVKRVVGLAGDTVAVDGKQLVVDGRKLEDEPVGDVQLDEDGAPTKTASFIAENSMFEERLGNERFRIVLRRAVEARAEPPVTVPVGHVFVVGDNRDASTDSRAPTFGPVPVSRLVGRVVGIAWSSGAGGVRRARLFSPVH